MHVNKCSCYYSIYRLDYIHVITTLESVCQIFMTSYQLESVQSLFLCFMWMLIGLIWGERGPREDRKII